jgi:acetyltransferase/esterase
MPSLEVPGATLYYEVTGTGPLLLCIPGANGSAEGFSQLATHLASHFTVLTYDRRGFSRSYLSGSQDYSQRLQTDADDAQRLISHLSSEPATVLGNSSGAIVALELLTRHPSVVRTLIPHEPPALKVLPDSTALKSELQEVYDTYRAHGVHPAMQKFGDAVKAGDETTKILQMAFDARNGPFVAANVMYWFERELMVYPAADIDVAALRQHRGSILLANGRESDAQATQYRANVVMAEEMGLELVILPGAHVGFRSHPEEFARELLDALRKKDGFYARL